MAVDISQLESQKTDLEQKIAQKEKEMRHLSRRVSEIQVEIIELKGQLKLVEKMINTIKK